ncbi:MAG: hypothetical protein ACHQYP_09530 [Nitrospiria bacterium]
MDDKEITQKMLDLFSNPLFKMDFLDFLSQNTTGRDRSGKILLKFIRTRKRLSKFR